MSKAAKPAAEQNAAAKTKLTRAEKKQIDAVIRKYKGDGKPHTAQESIPYHTMHQDGICYLGGKSYSKSIEFYDVNRSEERRVELSGRFHPCAAQLCQPKERPGADCTEL